MKRITLIFMAALLLPATALAQLGAQAKSLDSIFSMLHQQNQFNGSVLIAEKGEIILKKGYGYSNENTKESNNSTTIFELASCSKQFTAAAIMVLKRQGKLSFDDKLTKYLPELALWDNVTINNLLRHTSGLPEYIMDMSAGWDKTKIASNYDLVSFYAARKDTLQFTPGTRHEYNNTNYALLATIVERASGQQFSDFLVKHIFKPLDMKNTFIYNRRQHPKMIQNYAIGYVWAHSSFDKVTSDDPRYGEHMVYSLDGIYGNAKVNSSIEDIYKWITALKNNALFSQTEFEEMTAVTQTSAGEAIPYGYGLDVSKGDGRFAFGHTGYWDGYATFIYHDVVRDRTIITLQNVKTGACPVDNIFQILNGQPLKMEFRKKVSLSENEMQKYTGTYMNNDDKEDPHIITFLNNHLIYNTEKTPWDMRFFPVAANEFQAVRQGGVDGVLQFTTLENGDIKLEMLQYGRLIGSGIKHNGTPLKKS